MIKKISQLDKLPQVAQTDAANDSSKLLLEVSYKTVDDIGSGTAADELQYYNSYQIDFKELKKILEIEKFESILSGALSVISGDLSVGTPGDPTNDRLTADGHQYRPDNEHTLECYSKLNMQNQVKFHGETEFHNNVVITCDVETTNRDNPILEVTGVAKFNQTIFGTAYRAQWGDVAEYYAADKTYEPGTLVKFGGQEEVTLAADHANAVVTTNPAFVLNDSSFLTEEVRYPVCIALAGRVPVKVKGSVKKFDRIVLSKDEPGVGIVDSFADRSQVIAKALEDNCYIGTKLVLCTTKFNLD